MEKHPLLGLACPSTRLCLGLQNRAPLEAMGATPPAKLYASADPMNPSPWKAANIDLAGRLSALSCASEKLCFAVDSSGHVVVGRAFTYEQLQALLRSSVAATSRLRAKGNSIVLELSAPLACDVSVRLFGPPQRSVQGPKRLLLGRGDSAFSEAASQTVRVALTAAGRRLLDHRGKLRLVGRLIFSKTGRGSVVINRALALHR
jgi:hypothetical protein